MLLGRSQRLAALLPRSLCLSKNLTGPQLWLSRDLCGHQGVASKLLGAHQGAALTLREARASSSGRLQLADKYLGLEKNVW